ncbi:MAG: hypothetical protein CM15mV90_270 [uncultured marine virus]|nr:MAG: hypothetical protein CM15mV90_270 [uncultured marine virus]
MHTQAQRLLKAQSKTYGADLVQTQASPLAFTEAMLADADVNDAANGGETEFNSGNVVDLLGNVVDANPKRSLWKRRFNYLWSQPLSTQAYNRALGGPVLTVLAQLVQMQKASSGIIWATHPFEGIKPACARYANRPYGCSTKSNLYPELA